MQHCLYELDTDWSSCRMLWPPHSLSHPIYHPTPRSRSDAVQARDRHWQSDALSVITTMPSGERLWVGADMEAVPHDAPHLHRLSVVSKKSAEGRVSVGC